MTRTCKICGSTDLTKRKDGSYCCDYCGATFTADEFGEKPEVTDDLTETIEKVKYGICTINCYCERSSSAEDWNSAGTGWYIGQGVILTNAHVALVEKDTFNPQTYPLIRACFTYFSKQIVAEVRMIEVDIINDIAVLLLTEDVKELHGHEIRFPEKEDYKLGQKVFTIGNSIGRGLVPQTGIISDVCYNKAHSNIDNKEYFSSKYNNHTYNAFNNLRITIMLQCGNSGGPLLDYSTGKAIGICKASMMEIERETIIGINGDSNIGLTGHHYVDKPDLSYASRLSAIKNILKNVRFKF